MVGVGAATTGGELLEKLHVQVEGSGRRVVVLSHGFGTDKSAWKWVLPYLTRPYLRRDYRVVLYDLVFAGCVSPRHYDPKRYVDVDAYVEDLFAVLEALGVDRCVFVGHSFSAMIGMVAAMRRPSLFEKLVLICASPRFLNDGEYHGGFEREDIDAVLADMQLNFLKWAAGYAPMLVGADAPEAVQEFSRTLFSMQPDISLHVCQTVMNTDLRGVLGMVKVPCVVVHTEGDESVPENVAGYLQEHLGGPTVVEKLRSRGHLPHLTAPQAVADVLRRAL